MKITVKLRFKAPPERINYDNIAPGMVFEYEDGVKALKLVSGNAVLLTYSNDDGGNDGWFDLALGYKTRMPVTRILGRLIEIVVQEE